jgi:two-component system, OmpR family, sensor kinase
MRRWWRKPRSLRGRLLMGVMVVTAIGLVAADVAGVSALQSYLSQQVDDQLGLALSSTEHDLTADNRLGYTVPRAADNCAMEVVGADGAQLARFGSTDAVPAPSVADIRAYAASGTAVTINDGGLFRVRVGAISAGRHLIVSESLKWSNQVLYRLIAIELVVTLMALVLAAALAVWVSRLVLKPLEDMATTAARIVEGELSHRVEVARAPTEIAALGLSMNQMLGRIEDAFTQRRLAEDRLRRFIADASHELRTPITSITGYAQLARKGALADPIQLEDAMSRVEDESKRIASLVDELLLLARLDQGRPLDHTELDLAELVAAAVRDARAAEPARTLTLDVADGRYAVIGDEDRVRQLIGNLLANVRAHTPAGAGAEVRISRAGGDHVVDVIDSGPGIPPEARDRVFERFYRVDRARHRAAGSGKGSGLGLSIVAAIADAHHGAVRVLPSAGGAWLRLTIPAADGIRDVAAVGTADRQIPSQL